MKKISILIPAYNEETTLPLLYPELTSFFNSFAFTDGMPKYEFEVLFVNDGSKDNTLKILQDLHDRDSRIHYVSLSRNFGKENALLAGFDYVTGDCCVIMDADLQHPLEAVLQMVELWEQGYEDVYGSRITRGKESWLRKKATMTYYSLLQNATRIEILPNVGDFRLLDRRCINALRKLRESQRYTKGLYCWIGFRKTEILFEQKDSARAQSSFNYRALFNLAVEGITSYTTSPLRISGVIGSIVAILALVYLVFIVFKTIFYGEEIQGFPTLMCCMLLLGGIQLLAIGIIGEYVGRIFNETKNRPVYIADIYDGNKV